MPKFCDFSEKKCPNMDKQDNSCLLRNIWNCPYKTEKHFTPAEVREKINNYLMITYGRFFEAKRCTNMYREADQILALIKEANGYVQIRKGDIFWTREQLSTPDWAAKYYKE